MNKEDIIKFIYKRRKIQSDIRTANYKFDNSNNYPYKVARKIIDELDIILERIK